jgi:hypothetical protein
MKDALLGTSSDPTSDASSVIPEGTQVIVNESCRPQNDVPPHYDPDTLEPFTPALDD